MSNTGRRILVTGGAGFIGSEVVRQLACQGREILVLDNLASGKRENLADLQGPVRLIVGNILNSKLLKTSMNNVDSVFHMACLGVRHSIHSPLQNHRVNAEGTLRLLLAAQSAKVRRFIYVSSSEVYGAAVRLPISEEHPTFPTTVYGASKLAGECYVRAFHRTHRMPTIIVRPFNTYGPRCHHEGDSGEVIPKFMLRCLAGRPMVLFGNGKQTRDFTYVTDIAKGILMIASCNQAVGETINLGSSSMVRIKDLAPIVASIAGRNGARIIYDPPRPGDVPRLQADTAKARHMLGFEPGVPLEAGLKRLRDWYLQLGRSPEELLKEERQRNWTNRRGR